MTFEMKFSQIDQCFRPKFENFVELGEPTLIEGNFTENGDYNAKDEDANGYSKVTVNVQPPLQDIIITENGTHTADGEYYGLGEVVVNVPPTADPQLARYIEGTLTELYCEGATKIAQSRFQAETGLVSVDLPNVKSITYQAFLSCSNLISLYAQNATSIGNYAFRNCIKLKNLYVPKVATIGNYSFQEAGIENAYLPSLTQLGRYGLYYAYLLKSAVLPKSTAVKNYAFSKCFSLTAILLGYADGVIENEGTKVFDNCYHILGTVNATYNPNGAKDGYIYVPLSLVADYRVATNWVEFATQIMPFVSTVEELANIDGTTYDHACVWGDGEDFTEYYFNGTAWEVFTR